MSTEEIEEQWGRLLIAGGTDFAVLGRRDRSGKMISTGQPDLPSVHIVRSVANIRFKRVFTSHSSCHSVLIDSKNHAWLYGRNEQSQLGGPIPEEFCPRHKIISGPDAGMYAAPSAYTPFPLRALPDEIVPKRLAKQEIAYAACGRHHTILVTTKGEAWAAGQNTVGQCGQSHGDTIGTWSRITGALREEHVVAASCGVTFTVLLTASGRVYTLGSGEHGQLGNGYTGEHIAQARVFFTEQSDPYLVKGALQGKNIVEISTGQQHAIARDDQGVCYAWGFGGFGRLGTEIQKDEMTPVAIPYFSERNNRASQIACGPACSMFVDKSNNAPLLCGRWKNSGDGSSGQPWMFPKQLAELSSIPARHIACGSVTLFVSVADSDGDYMMAWGQNAAYGELGLGSDAPRSASRPTRVEALDSIGILDIAAGQAMTFYIGKPPVTSTSEIDPSSEHAANDNEDIISATVDEELTANGEKTITVQETAVVPSEKSSNKMKDETIKELPTLNPGQSYWSLSKIDLSGFPFWSYCDGVEIDKEYLARYEQQKKKERSNAGPISPIPTETVATQWEALPRFPAIQKISDLCVICMEEKDDTMIECERCEDDFHVSCLDPPLTNIPPGEWFCPKCTNATSDAHYAHLRQEIKDKELRAAEASAASSSTDSSQHSSSQIQSQSQPEMSLKLTLKRSHTPETSDTSSKKLKE